MILSYNFLPLSILPTRITDSSSTLIDHIYFRSNYNNDSIDLNNTLSGCLVTDISDHLANVLILSSSKKFETPLSRPLTRVFSPTNKNNFLNEINSHDWYSNVYNCNDVNIAYNNFITFLNQSFEKCFPLTRISRKRSKDKKWVSSEIIKSCNLKSHLYKVWINSKNIDDKNKYKIHIATHNKLVKTYKYNYFKNIFDSRLHNTKSIWKEINHLCSVSSNKSQNILAIKKLLVDGIAITDPLSIASKFNEYFCNVGNNLAANLPPSNPLYNHNQYLPHPLYNSFVCESITPLEVSTIISKLKSRNS